MTKKKMNGLGALSQLVFSTDPEAMRPEEETVPDTPGPGTQQLRVRIEKKHRGGKTVTIIDGFEGKEEDLAELGKRLKTKCGAGGTAKDGEILVQGDYREKVVAWLKEWGYTKTKG